jgi:hypothetical protein
MVSKKFRPKSSYFTEHSSLVQAQQLLIFLLFLFQ